MCFPHELSKDVLQYHVYTLFKISAKDMDESYFNFKYITYDFFYIAVCSKYFSTFLRTNRFFNRLKCIVGSPWLIALWLLPRYNWNLVESGIKHHNP